MRTIKNYTVEDVPIGTGGMGQVLRGKDPNGLDVAIKEILPQFVNNPEYRKRIDKEIDFLKKMDDANVVKIYNHFELNENLYIVMELVTGINLEDYVRQRGMLSPSDASHLMVRLLKTMQYIHDKGVVHRDIKPGNIMLRPNNDICVLDFGIAKNTETQSGEEQTVVGTILGTDGYMSPEQANGFAVDKRTDIYSLGCVMYYLLTAHHAFLTDGNKNLQIDIVSGSFPRLSRYRADIPAIYQEILDMATDKNMLKRYQNCSDFAKALTAAEAQINESKPSVDGPTVPRVNEKPNPPAPVKVKDVKISIGRENCDLCIAINCNKVSRHHADISVKSTNNGFNYVYTDRSTNGSIIDGKTYTKGMSCTIPANHRPNILVSNDPLVRLDWNKVLKALNTKMKMVNGIDLPIDDSTSGEVYADEYIDNNQGGGLMTAIKRFFKKIFG